MKFLDEAQITIQSGKWWDGIVSARRESGIPYGWPAWWNGWRGGSVTLQASKDENTLLPFRYIREYKAKAGEPWRSKDQYGADADDITIIVPVGTLVTDEETWALLYHFIQDQELRVAARGWRWGLGNIQFKDAINQFPEFALLWEPWHTRTLKLELQLFADLALIWTPSVGKSSLINTVSKTKAKVADYPFTTLVPHLGSVQHDNYRFNIVDIPWLISWAAEGKGLGNAFLRHILKARVLTFVTDVSRYDTGINEVSLLLKELIQYVESKLHPLNEDDNPYGELDVVVEQHDEQEVVYLSVYHTHEEKKECLLKKHLQILVNKYDLLNDEEIVQEYKHALRQDINTFLKTQKIKPITDHIWYHNTFVVSAATHIGIEGWLDHTARSLSLLPVEESYVAPVAIQAANIDPIVDITDQEKEKLLQEWYLDDMHAKHAKVWYVSEPEFARLVYILPRWNDEAELRFRKKLAEEGMMHMLEHNGIRKWDILKVRSYYAWVPEKHVLY